MISASSLCTPKTWENNCNHFSSEGTTPRKLFFFWGGLVVTESKCAEVTYPVIGSIDSTSLLENVLEFNVRSTIFFFFLWTTIEYLWGDGERKLLSNATEYGQNYYCVSVKILDMRENDWDTKDTCSKVAFEL